MLNLRTKHIILSHDVIFLNRTYSEYLSRKENTKADTYIPQDEYESQNWAHVKCYPFKNEIKDETVKIEENFNTEKDYRGNKTHRRLSIAFFKARKSIKTKL